MDRETGETGLAIVRAGFDEEPAKLEGWFIRRPPKVPRVLGTAALGRFDVLAESVVGNGPAFLFTEVAVEDPDVAEGPAAPVLSSGFSTSSSSAPHISLYAVRFV